MAISYPQICPDSRSFAPGQYATTQPAYLEYVESGRQWSGVSFGSELQLGYEDLTEAQAALFTDAYEDSRSGFHVLDIGTEPAGGIGDAGLAARITATTWRFAEPPVVELKSAGRYRVSVKLTSELPAFADVAVAGISVPGAEAALSWLDVDISEQPVCSGPLLDPAIPPTAPVADFWVLQYVGSDITVQDSKSFQSPNGECYLASSVSTGGVAYLAITKASKRGVHAWTRFIQLETTVATDLKTVHFGVDESTGRVFLTRYFKATTTGALMQCLFYCFSSAGALLWSSRIQFPNLHPLNLGRAAIRGVHYNPSTNYLAFIGTGGYTFPLGDTDNIFYGLLDAATGSLVSCKCVRGSALNQAVFRLPSTASLLLSATTGKYVAFFGGTSSPYSGTSATGTWALVFDATTGEQDSFYNYSSASNISEVIALPGGGYLGVTANTANGIVTFSSDLTTVTSIRTASFGLDGTKVVGIERLASGETLVAVRSANLAIGTPTAGGDFTGGVFGDCTVYRWNSDFTAITGTTILKATLVSSWGGYGDNGLVKERCLVARGSGGSGSTPAQMMLVNYTTSIPYEGTYIFSLAINSNTSQVGFNTETISQSAAGPAIGSAASPGWSPANATLASAAPVEAFVFGAGLASGSFALYENPILNPPAP